MSMKNEEDRTPGATGRYPDGRLGPDDQGELRALGIVQGKVVIDLGDKPVKWMAMTPEQARALAAMLVAVADAAEGKPS